MRTLYITMAAIEAGAGMALVSCPSAIVAILLGSGLDTSAAVALGRLAGVALLALSVACWLAQYDVQSRAARRVAIAMVVYNLGATAILGAAGIWARPVGVALWPAVGVHVAMTVWCVTGILGKPTRVATGAR